RGSSGGRRSANGWLRSPELTAARSPLVLPKQEGRHTAVSAEYRRAGPRSRSGAETTFMATAFASLQVLPGGRASGEAHPRAPCRGSRSPCRLLRAADLAVAISLAM